MAPAPPYTQLMATTEFDPFLRAALAAVEPAQATRRALTRSDLEGARRVYIVGAGKAGVAMARAAAEIAGSKLVGGVMSVPVAPIEPIQGVRCIVGGHPLPTDGSLAAGRAVADLLAEVDEDDLVLALISGGGSALLELPVDGVSLADLQQLTELALRSGAPIGALNRMRWCVSQLKGGGLLRMAAPARVLGLVLSDVIGNPLDIIASGPTVRPDLSGATAWDIAQQFDLAARLPESIRARLRTGPEAPAEVAVENRIIASNRMAGEAVLGAARHLGYVGRSLGDDWQGEAREAGRRFARAALAVEPGTPTCLIAGGETTVTVRGSGRGGRNQEAALSAALEISGRSDIRIAAFGTDGIDGPTDAAGAIVSGDTAARAARLGLDPDRVLADNDSYVFHAALDGLIVTGPTGTNVNDLMIALVG